MPSQSLIFVLELYLTLDLKIQKGITKKYSPHENVPGLLYRPEPENINLYFFHLKSRKVPSTLADQPHSLEEKTAYCIKFSAPTQNKR
jgi:hypothetical protein